MSGETKREVLAASARLDVVTHRLRTLCTGAIAHPTEAGSPLVEWAAKWLAYDREDSQLRAEIDHYVRNGQRAQWKAAVEARAALKVESHPGPMPR